MEAIQNQKAEFVCEVRISAAPETIFPFLIDPAKMTQWMGIRAESQPHQGGIYRVSINPKHVARGEYIEVKPHHKVVFTWGWEGNPELPPGSSTVEFTLTPQGADTLLRLRHYNLSAEEAKSHGEGWEHYLPRLVECGTGRDPGPDAWAKEQQ